MNGLGILAIGAAGILIVIGFAVFLRWEDARDDRAGFPDPGHPGFADIQRPPELDHQPRPFPLPTMHELPTLDGAVWHPRPQSSPAEPPPPAPAPAREGQGTAAAAVAPSATPPAPAPPPLPDPAYAAANPTAYPLAWLESDTFVGGLAAIKDGAP